jgi:hypothetical protein
LNRNCFANQPALAAFGFGVFSPPGFDRLTVARNYLRHSEFATGFSRWFAHPSLAFRQPASAGTGVDTVANQ